jgi:hypothetical protein
MKTLAIFFSFLAGSVVISAKNTLVLEGRYQNKNIYVMNSFTDDGIGFCAYEVRVNDQVVSDEINSSAFEIDLTKFNLNLGQQIVITIKHHDSCSPKILNPGGLQPAPDFEIASMELSVQGLLKWASTREAAELPYIIEQFKWNKWVKVGEVNSIGKSGKNDYSFQVNLTSGENKFRLVQRNLNGQMKISNSITVSSSEASVELNYNAKSKSVDFSRPTSYEVYDAFGIIRKRGYAQKIDMEDLENGDYYINFDNANKKVRKK